MVEWPIDRSEGDDASRPGSGVLVLAVWPCPDGSKPKPGGKPKPARTPTSAPRPGRREGPA
jgi:hypothetical protein